jgi:hypothetical protein
LNQQEMLEKLADFLTTQQLDTIRLEKEIEEVRKIK